MDVPSGIILIWSGAILDIPVGWVLCDGNNGTPNLMDRFVAGAGDSYAVDASGGSLTHNHTFTTDGHLHNVQAGFPLNGGFSWKSPTEISTDSGTTGNSNNTPQYYALAYIMKT